ncbi:MAG: D-alanyl-D-alanine carboxypeptidase/D-alanyl-D-alanine-endopeptidase [Acidobacteriia bacterium]|nr:D-alanyl-D-alanine carboxypeptidase/D-alanyl-D-alanine-endopeptidase [Terriglobia bacterium]
MNLQRKTKDRILTFGLLVSILLLLFTGPLHARKKRPTAPPLDQQVEQILKSSPIANGFFGIQVYSLDRNQVVFEKDADHLFVPASNTKLYTISTALARLPLDHRFHTTLETSGRIDKFGRLLGDLILVGRGDPNLSNRVLPYDPKATRTESKLQAIDTLANQLVSKGVKSINGDLVGDDSFFINEPVGDSWGWDDLMWWFGAPVSALTLNDNVFSLALAPAERVGEPAFIIVDPFYHGLKIQNELITTPAGTERRVHLERSPGSSLLHVWGTFPLDAKPQQESLAVEEPARVAAEALRRALEAKGVVLYGRVRVLHRELWDVGPTIGAPPLKIAQRTVLAEIVSHPLSEDLKVIAKVSQNLHAEVLLRLIGAQVKNEGSVRAGLAAEHEFLNQAGVNDNDYQLNDGSGMDGHNLVAPRATVQLLRYNWAQPYRDAFVDLLPIAGTDGTIASRFKETAAAGKVFAKTGTLTHANALSGYATSPSGEHFAFSMMTNNHAQDSKLATDTMDKVLETILTYPPAATKIRRTSRR